MFVPNGNDGTIARHSQREDDTDEEDEDAPGDYIGDRLAHARLEATGQLYREVCRSAIDANFLQCS